MANVVVLSVLLCGGLCCSVVSTVQCGGQYCSVVASVVLPH